MGTVLMAVFVFHPFQHTTATVVVEVGIDIRQRDTVWIEETLKQQVVLQRIDLGDAETVGHHRTSSGATSRTYHHAKLVASGVDEVLHDEEVARETHRLHDVELKLHTIQDLCGETGHFGIFGCSIAPDSPLIGELGQIVGLELDAVDLVIATQFLDLLLTFLRRQRVLAVLIGGELLIELFFGIFLAPLGLSAE